MCLSQNIGVLYFRIIFIKNLTEHLCIRFELNMQAFATMVQAQKTTKFCFANLDDLWNFTEQMPKTFETPYRTVFR